MPVLKFFLSADILVPSDKDFRIKKNIYPIVVKIITNSVFVHIEYKKSSMELK